MATIKEVDNIFFNRRMELDIVRTLLEVCNALRCEPIEVVDRINTLIEANILLTDKQKERNEDENDGTGIIQQSQEGS